MERGIASFVDAVFLMLISATAAAILVYSASHYGAGLQRQSSRLVMEYYARQTIRTIAAASVVRPGCDKPDYLLAYMKESLAKNGSLDNETLKDINTVISKALKPLTGYYDYAIYLSSDDTGVNQIFGVCHDCSTGTNCTPKWFDLTDGSTIQPFIKTLFSSLYVYSAYAPVRIRSDTGGGVTYGVLLIRFYLWPAGTVDCPS